MNEEFRKFAQSNAYILIAAWIAILGINTILMLATLDSGFSTFISLTTPFLIIVYGLLWFIGVKAMFENHKKLQVADDVGQGLSARGWKNE